MRGTVLARIMKKSVLKDLPLVRGVTSGVERETCNCI